MLRRIISAGVLVAVAAGCGSGPTGPSGADLFTWTVDGVSVAANDMGAGRAPGGGGYLVGANCTSGAHLNITFFTPHNFSVGTFVVANAVGNVYGASMTTDSKTSTGPSWDAGAGGGGSGTLTIATVDGSRISGSFSFQMDPRRGTSATGTKSVSGNFDLSFNDNTIC
jgi:hypothetical protein